MSAVTSRGDGYVQNALLQATQNGQDAGPAGDVNAVKTPAAVKDAVMCCDNQKVGHDTVEDGSGVKPSPREVGGDDPDRDPPGVANAGEIMELRQLESCLGDRNTPPGEFKKALSRLIAMPAPAKLGSVHDRRAAAVMSRQAGSAMAAATRGRDVFSGDGLALAEEATRAYSGLMEGLDKLTSGDGAATVRAAAGEIASALGSLIRIAVGDDKEKLQAVADCLKGIGDSRAAGLEAVAENRASIEAALQGMAPEAGKNGDAVGSMRRAAEGLRRIAGAADGAQTLARLPEAERLAGSFVDAAGELALALSGSGLQDNQPVLDQLRDFISLAAAGAEAVEKLCGRDKSFPLVLNGERAELALADAATMTAYMDELDAFMDSLEQKRYDTVQQALDAVAAPPDADVPAALRREMEKKATALERRIQELRDGFAEEQLPLITELLRSGDMDAALEKCAVILEQPLVSGEMRAEAADAAVKALRAGNEEALREVKDLEAEIVEFAKYSGVRTSEERTAAAARLDGFAHKINAQLARLEQANAEERAKLTENAARKAILGDQAERVSALLADIAGEIDSAKGALLVNARTALTLLRFTNTINNKLSPDVVFDKGLPGLMSILDKFTLGEQKRSTLLARLETSPGDLAADERALVHGQLSNAMTTGQKGNDPIKTALDRLASGQKLEKGDLDALCRSSVFILSRDEAAALKTQVEAASANNFAAMNERLAALGGRCKSADAAARETAWVNFGKDAGKLSAEAKSLLLPADFEKFEESMGKLRTGNLPGMASLCISRAKAAGATATTDIKALENLLDRSDCDIEFCTLAVIKGKVNDIVKRGNAEEARKAEEAIDLLAQSRPDLDDACLLLKSENIRGRAFRYRNDMTRDDRNTAWKKQKAEKAQELQQMRLRHESNRLVRTCQSMLPKGESADELRNMSAADFIKAFMSKSLLGEKFDLFVIQAAWLRRCAEPAKPDADEDQLFQEFQQGLPGQYRAENMPFLRGQLQRGLLSAANSARLDDFLGSESSRFNRSGIRHQLLSLLGSATGAVLADSDRMDKMLVDLNRPENHGAAERVAKRILRRGGGIGGGAIAADNLKMMLPERKKANAPNKAGNAAEQIVNAGTALTVNKRATEREFALMDELNRKQDELIQRFPLVGDIARSRHSNRTPGQNPSVFAKGTGVAATVLAIDAVIADKIQALPSAGWEGRKDLLSGIPVKKGKTNLLAMKEMKTIFDLGAKKLADDFFGALDKAKNAGNEQEFTEAVNAMRTAIGDHRLVERAETVLAFKEKDNDSLEKKLGEMKMGAGVKEYLSGNYTDLYRAYDRLPSSIKKEDQGKHPEHYLSTPLVKSLKKMANVVLLSAFTSGDASVSFDNFIAAFAGKRNTNDKSYNRAVTLMAGAIIEAYQMTLPGDAAKAQAAAKKYAGRVAEHFLLRAIDRYQNAKGGATARLTAQDAGNKAYANTGKLGKSAKNAMLADFRSINLNTAIHNLKKNSVLQLNSQTGLSVSAEAGSAELSLSIAATHGIALERDGAGKLNLYLSRGMAVSLGISVSALDTFSAQAGVSGSAAGGYRLEFKDETQCVNFMAALLGGDVDDVDADGFGQVSRIDQSALRLSVKVEASIASLVEKGMPVIDAVQYGVAEALFGDSDSSRLIRLGAEAEASGGLEMTTRQSGADTHSIYTVTGSVAADAKASVGQNKEYGAEASASAAFVATLDAHYRDAQLINAAMTRTFEFSGPVDADAVDAILRRFGIDNPHAAQYVADHAAAGENVVLHIDAELSPAGLEKCREAGKKGDAERLWALRDRANYDNSLIRVETTERTVAAQKSLTVEPGDNPAGIKTGAVAATADGSIVRTREFRARPAARAGQRPGKMEKP